MSPASTRNIMEVAGKACSSSYSHLQFLYSSGAGDPIVGDIAVLLIYTKAVDVLNMNFNGLQLQCCCLANSPKLYNIASLQGWHLNCNSLRMSAKNGLTYRILTEEDHVNVVQFTRKHFIPFEPLSVAVGVRAEEEHNFPELVIKNSLWQKVSIGVFDNSNGKLCAIRLNMLGKHMKSLPYEDNSSKHSDNSNVIARIISCAKKGLEQYFPDENFMEHEFVIVDQSYGRRGIATELYRQSESLARDHDCDRMRVTCTSHYTRRSVEKVGYVVLKELLYVDYRDNVTGLKPFTSMPPPHSSIAVLMKKLDQE